MFGKKIYTTSMLTIFRLVIFFVVIFFLNELMLNTYTYEKFQADGRFKIIDVLQYHYRYPYEFISLFLILIVPAIYYSFIRGVGFFEKGFIFNRGLPFMNKKVSFEEVKKYKLLHPNHILSIHTHKGELYLIADNSIERVVAILDQHHIPGDFTQDDYVNLISNFKKFLMIVMGFSVFVFVLLKLKLFEGVGF
jgi:hypothetical protein